jgi:hypothetical protein
LKRGEKRGMEKKNMFEVVNSLREAIIEYKEKRELFCGFRGELEVLDPIVQKIENTFEFLLPNGFDYFVDHIVDYSTEDLFFIEEKAANNELKAITYSSTRGSEIVLKNDEVIKRPNMLMLR